MITYPFQILKKRLQLTVAELREIDFYLEQDSLTDKDARILACPGLYIEFSPQGNLRTLGGDIQSVKMHVIAHLITENVMDSEKRIKKDQPTDHMRIFDKVFKNLHGFSAKLSYLDDFAALLNTENDQRSFNSLTRFAFTSPHKIRRALMKSTQSFSCVMYDHAALKTYTHPNPEPLLEVDTSIE